MKIIIYKLLFVVYLLLGVNQLQAQDPVSQIFYIPVPEDDMEETFSNVNDDADGNIITYISINSNTDNNILYYDHWEDGYEDDISNPTQSSTEVYTLSSGEIKLFQNEIDPTTYETDLSTFDYDGRDKLAATDGITVTRLGWPANNVSTLLAGAAEVYPTYYLGLNYIVPIGEDMDSGDGERSFQITDIHVMATEDNTTVAIDHDADGSVDINQVLNEGETIYLDSRGSNDYENYAGATINADKKIAVNLTTGDAGSTYEERWFTLQPTEKWDNIYYSPVNDVIGSGDTRVYVYNPNNYSISIQVNNSSDNNGSSISSSTFTVSANDWGSYQLNGGLRSGFKFSSSDNFYAIASYDDYDSAHDWGFSLVPNKVLTTSFLMGYGNGYDPTDDNTNEENGSPIWVTTAEDTYVYVDWNNDQIPDPVDRDGDGDADNLSSGTVQGIHLFNYLNTRLYKPDNYPNNGDNVNDQTGAFVYTKQESTNTNYYSGNEGGLIAGAWGADAENASAAEPGFDVGIGIIPLPLFSAGKNITLSNDRDGDNKISIGDEVEFKISIKNKGTRPLDLYLEDELPSQYDYVLNSTTLETSDGTTQVPDNSSGSSDFPFDNGGDYLGNLPVGEEWIVRLRMDIPNDDQYCGEIISNIAYVKTLGLDGVTIETNNAERIIDCSVVGLSEFYAYDLQLGWGLHQFKLIYKIVNYGGNELEKIVLENDIQSLMNIDAFPASYTVENVVSPASDIYLFNSGYTYRQTDSSNLNQNYDGDSDNIIADDFNLDVGEYTLIEVVHTIDLLGLPRFYQDNSMVTANTINSSRVHSDMSQDGTDPNANGTMTVNNRPDPTDDSDPTIFAFSLLPVELSWFDVTANDCEALIEWKTETETNNDKFLVERSEDGVNFEIIDEVEGAGTTTDEHYYEYIDDDISAELYYYRITQVDLDGDTESFNIKEATFAGCDANSELTVYPNPVTDQSVVSIPDQFINGNEAELLIYSASGQMVFHQSVETSSGRTTANLFGQLAKGVYMVFVVDEKGQQSNVVKVVK